MTAEEVAHLLGLQPHPEGGFFRETFRDPAGDGGRDLSTAIYYLLRDGEVSAWHRVRDAAEVWHHYLGASVELTLSVDGRSTEAVRLGSGLAAGERPQAVVPAGVWQTARAVGGWALIGCTVAPAFEFESFEMAPVGWGPGGKDSKDFKDPKDPKDSTG